MTTPSPSKRVRLTISVPEKVHEAYRYMSEVTGRSIGMEMGEWLDATLLAAVHMTQQMAAARSAPREAVAHIHDLTEALASVERVRRGSASALTGAGRRAVEPHGALRRANPPASNTGGKGHQTPEASTRSRGAK